MPPPDPENMPQWMQQQMQYIQQMHQYMQQCQQYAQVSLYFEVAFFVESIL